MSFRLGNGHLRRKVFERTTPEGFGAVSPEAFAAFDGAIIERGFGTAEAIASDAPPGEGGGALITGARLLGHSSSQNSR